MFLGLLGSIRAQHGLMKSRPSYITPRPECLGEGLPDKDKEECQEHSTENGQWG